MNIVLATLTMALSAAAPPTTEPPTTTPSSTAPTTTAAPNTAPSTTAPIPEGYVPLVDDTDSIVIAVPEAWTDVDTAPKVDVEGTSLPYIAASPDLESSSDTFDTPGVLYVAFPFTADPLTLLEEFGLREGCETFEVTTYDDPVFVGVVQAGTNCGPNAMTWNMVVANPADESFTARLQVKTANAEELLTIRRTFNYPGSTPRDPNATRRQPRTPTTTAANDDHGPDDNWLTRPTSPTDGCSGTERSPKHPSVAEERRRCATTGRPR